MILDGHIHRRQGKEHEGGPEDFARELTEAGVDGGVLISLRPPSFGASTPLSAEQRWEDVLRWTEPSDHLYPFFWIDPLAADAPQQVARAVRAGVAGFKIICDRFYPGDERVLETARAIAEQGKPLLFHSGILWDGKPSGIYNRPVNFEALLAVPGLRFAMAHISWPWCDELVAVYGKFLNARAASAGAERPPELFVDTTPGTPPLFRRDALTKLYATGYDVTRNVVFGSDSAAPGYNGPWVHEWIERDRAILNELGITEQAISDLFSTNLLRFLGLVHEEGTREIPLPGR